MNLLQRINKVRQDVAYIQKDKAVSTGASGSYKAVTHDMVTAIVREHLVTHGIVILPSFVSGKMSEPAQLDPAKINRQWLYEAVYDFTFANIDDPADKLTVRIEAHANDNADKAPGKALSYAKKYAVLKVFEIETGEDEESRVREEFNAAPHIEAMKAAATLEDLKAAFEAGLKAATETGTPSDIKVITGAKNEEGKRITAAMPMSEAKFNEALDAVKAGRYPLAELHKRTLTDAQQKTLADYEASLT